MKKWAVTISFVIQAETRTKAWELSKELCAKKLRDLANVNTVSSKPVPSEEWIAVNEPINKTLKVHDMVVVYEDPITEQKLEGEACLLHKIEDMPDGLERWKVCFKGEDGGVYERTINKANKI